LKSTRPVLAAGWTGRLPAARGASPGLATARYYRHRDGVGLDVVKAMVTLATDPKPYRIASDHDLARLSNHGSIVIAEDAVLAVASDVAYRREVCG
jgi:hypothetical protein